MLFRSNTLYLKHKDKAQLERAYNAAKESELLNEFVPCPPELLENGGWYEFQTTNWGTKWDIDLIDTDWIDDDKLAVYFNTAWGPPIAWYDKMVELGFELEATYNEPGCCFCGSYTNEAGEDYYDYSDLDISNIPEELIEIYDLENYVDEMKQSEGE